MNDDSLRQPVVSIITPSFNRADIVHETAASIFGQTYPAWEWIIVDDGSSDNSMEIFRQYALNDSRVKVFARERDPKGACSCRNIAVDRSTGKYVMFLDTDDVLASFCLEQRVKSFAGNEDCDFIIFPMLMFSKHPGDSLLLWNVDSDKDDAVRVMYGDPVCQGTGTLWKKSSFVDIGMWDEQLALWQDIDLHLRALLKPLKYSKRMDLPPDVFIRTSEISLSRTGFHSPAKLKSRVRVFDTALSLVGLHHAFEKYRDGLRYMGKELLVGAANSNGFEQAMEVTTGLRKNQLLNYREKKLFDAYVWMRKLKLYKIGAIQNAIRRRIDKLIPPFIGSLNRVSYDKPVLY